MPISPFKAQLYGLIMSSKTPFYQIAKTLWLTCVLLLLSHGLFAQDYVDLLKVYYTYSPNNTFDTTAQTSDMTEAGAEILIPIPLKNGNALLTGLMFEQSSLKPGPQLNEPIQLYVINPRLGINWVHNKKWSGQYILLPQISSDLDGPLQKHDFQLGGIGLVNYKKSDRLSYRFGAYYNGALYGPGTFLIAGFYYTSPNQKWTFDFTLPIWADINYRLSESFSLGLRQDDMLRSYYLNDPLFTDNDEYLVELSPDTYLYLQWALAKNFIFQFKIGHSLGRSYKVFNVGDEIDLGFSGLNFGDDRNELSTDFSDGLIFQMRFHYRIFLADFQ